MENVKRSRNELVDFSLKGVCQAASVLVKETHLLDVTVDSELAGSESTDCKEERKLDMSDLLPRRFGTGKEITTYS